MRDEGVRTATVERAQVLGPHVREMVLRVEGAPLEFAPGQWISLRLPVGEKPPLIRAYTLAAPPTPDGTLTLCFDKVEGGIATDYLWNAPVAAPLEFTGPMGNFVLPEGDGALLLVARFTGIVPFRAMLLALDAAGANRRVHVVYGAATPADLTYDDELTALAARADWLDYHPILAAPADGWSGEVGTEIDLLKRLAPDWMPCVPMLCGVREFTAPARAFLMERFGLERRAVKVENYNGPAATATAR